MENYINELNQQQQEAVLYTDGPALVIAGAGSGKTRVLTYKIVHLLQHHHYDPWRILALTFTNKAAREMRERIETLVGSDTASKLWMGTFHSIFARILRNNAERIGYKSNFTIYDTSDSKSLIKSIIKEMDLDDKIYKPNIIASAISTAKNALISPQRYSVSRDLLEADRRARRPMTCAIYKTYCDRCFVAGAMDFDDLLYWTNVLLRDNTDILHHYQEYFQYILVDEYQDTNFAQHRIISALCEGNNNLCVVGDDAQSIYSFRGANIRNILSLKNAYPNLKIFKLEQNYRSTQNIVNAANSLIEKNTEQIRKQVFSKNESGNKIEVVQSYSDYEEGYLVSNKISQLKMSNHDSYDDYAILYRTNAQSRILEESLRKRNIPYRIYGGLSFYQRKEIKDAIAYFRLAINPNDDEALKRIINYPARGIGETTVNKLLRCAIDKKLSVWDVLSNINQHDVNINSGTAKKLQTFSDMISSFIKMIEEKHDAEIVARKIISETKLLSYLISDRTPESISKQENINELIKGINEFVVNRTEEGNGDRIYLNDYLAEISLATDQDSNDTSESKVTLMTVHAAKGLEFSNVFIVGVEEDLFPSALSLNSLSEIEEERRLLYVAITRAKQHCTMSYASSRYHNGQTKTCNPSRFIRDIDPTYLSLPMSMYGRSCSNYTNLSMNQYTSQQNNRNIVSSTSKSNNSINLNGATYHTVNEINTGTIIEHPRFGRGVIISIDNQSTSPRIVVKFTNTETKTLLLEFARFNIIDK